MDTTFRIIGGMILVIGVAMVIDNNWWGLLIQLIGWLILFSVNSESVTYRKMRKKELQRELRIASKRVLELSLKNHRLEEKLGNEKAEDEAKEVEEMDLHYCAFCDKRRLEKDMEKYKSKSGPKSGPNGRWVIYYVCKKCEK